MANFEVIPAVDIMEGKCVRLKQGKFDAKTVYDASPIEAAEKWEYLGATRLHIVDLDGAKTGIFTNIPIIKGIASKLRIPIQVGGGIRTRENAEELLEAGVDRIMLGTAVIDDPILVAEMCAKYNGRIAVSIDARGGKTAIKGWQVESNKPPMDLAKEAVQIGVKRFVYTDISRDGTLSGPNIEGIKAFAKATGAAVIASGGVSSYKDIEEIKDLNVYGVEGCIIGKALYNGTIELEKALEYNSK
jgi:phosphoribosylformimino-5-aminoimidazole carboxamide ribotide isomerase